MIRAVLFDVDFTLARPGPELGPEGYRRPASGTGWRSTLSATRQARLAALGSLQRHPELEHDDELWIVFTEQIVRGMGGDAEGARACAEDLVRAWELHERFTLYEDALPALAALREHGVKIGLVSNGSRDLDEFVVHHASTWTARSGRARSAARSRIRRSSGARSRCSTSSRRRRR